jgi:hypothetical protein
MYVMTRQAFLLRDLHALGDPALEFLDGFAADGKLDEMKRHDFEVSGQRRLLKASIIRRPGS